MHAFDVTGDGRLANHRLLSDCVIDGVKCGPDGIRADVYGNLWISSNAGRAVGYSGATCWSAEGSFPALRVASVTAA